MVDENREKSWTLLHTIYLNFFLKKGVNCIMNIYNNIITRSIRSWKYCLLWFAPHQALLILTEAKRMHEVQGPSFSYHKSDNNSLIVKLLTQFKTGSWLYFHVVITTTTTTRTPTKVFNGREEVRVWHRRIFLFKFLL